MSRAHERERGLDAHPWAAALLPRFAWLAARWPWFAAPVAFHAWPWAGRMSVWTSTAIGVAVVGHAWIGGRAWQRIETTRADEIHASAFTNASAHTRFEADGSSPLFRDEMSSDAPLSIAEKGAPHLRDGLSAGALQILSTLPTAKDGGQVDAGEGAIARRDSHGTNRVDGEGLSASSIPWADVSEADLLAAVAAGTRADAALPGLRSRARAAGVGVSSAREADDATRDAVETPLVPGETRGEGGGAAASARVRGVGGVGSIVTQWAQWVSDTAKRHDVAIDRFAVDDRAVAPEHHRNASDIDEHGGSATRDAAIDPTRHGLDYANADANAFTQASDASFPRLASVNEGGVMGANVERALPYTAAHIAIRGAFEPMAAFIAAIAAASPPVLVQAAQLMPDHESNGSRLAFQAVLYFVAPDTPRAADGGTGVRAAERSLSGMDHRSSHALPSALPSSAKDAASPTNPFRRRGHAQTDIVVLATFASGGQRAVLLARHPGAGGVRGIASTRSGMGAGESGNSQETALARPGETFADVRVMAVEADRVRLRPLMGGADLVVRLARDTGIHYAGTAP